MKEDNQNRSGEYVKSYSGSSYNKDERSHYTSRKEDAKPSDASRREVPPTAQTPPTPSTQRKKERRSLNKNPFLIWLLIVLMSTAFSWIMNDESFDLDEQSEETLDDPWSSDEEEFEEDLEDLEEDLEPVRDEANDAANDVALPSESESDSSAIAPHP